MTAREKLETVMTEDDSYPWEDLLGEGPVFHLSHLISDFFDAFEGSEHPGRFLEYGERKCLVDMGFSEPSMEELTTFMMLLDRFESRFCEPFIPGKQCDNGIKVLDYLVNMGIATTVLEETKDSSETGYMFSVDFVKKFYGKREDLIRTATVNRYGEVILPSTLARKELFYSGDSLERVRRLESTLTGSNLQLVMERQAERGRPQSIMYLFEGEPGTGKTEEAKQLAIISGKPLMIADAAKLNGMWIGESEKAYRSLFRTLRYVGALSKTAPILLFNEADGIMFKRNPNTQTSAGISYNACQTILLQELENFEGVFIATTNLTGALDPAFINRFTDRIRFPMPDAKVRESIWKSQLPQLSASLAAELAGKFVISGRSIQNIAGKCDIDEVLEGKFPPKERILRYCSEEAALQTHYEEKPTRRIGFAAAAG